jgi:nucleoside-diphosphate-sugar epimerase
MKIFITGGTGFIGANLVRDLINHHHNVGLLLRKEYKSWRLKGLSSRITPLASDLSDAEDLKRAVLAYHPDIIFHLAAYGSYPKTEADLDLMIRTNIIGTRNLFEAAGRTPVINAGSSSEYGIKPSAMREIDVCLPDNDYGWSKLSQTVFSQMKQAVTLRLFHVYGPWEEPARLIPHLIKAKIQKTPVRLINSIRDYVFVDDVIDAFRRALDRYGSLKGQVVNIGSGGQTNVRQLLGILEKIDPLKLDVTWDYVPVQTEPEIWCSDISKAREVLGWSPQHDLEKGLRKTYSWWKEYLR